MPRCFYVSWRLKGKGESRRRERLRALLCTRMPRLCTRAPFAYSRAPFVYPRTLLERLLDSISLCTRVPFMYSYVLCVIASPLRARVPFMYSHTLYIHECLYFPYSFVWNACHGVRSYHKAVQLIGNHVDIFWEISLVNDPRSTVRNQRL